MNRQRVYRPIVALLESVVKISAYRVISSFFATGAVNLAAAAWLTSKGGDVSDILFRIFDPRLSYLAQEGNPEREKVWNELVSIWLKRGLFKPEKAKRSNLVVDFVYRPGTLQEGLAMMVTAESTQGSGLFKPGTSDNPEFWVKFEANAGRDIAYMFPGYNIGFWSKFVLGKYGEHIVGQPNEKPSLFVRLLEAVRRFIRNTLG